MVRLPPSHDPYDLALAACRRGNALILVPSLGQARLLGARLRRGGVSIGLYPRDWAPIAAGGSAIGTRSAAWAPMCDLAAVVVFDEHDEGHQQEQSPTWNARDVALERARRAGVPCVLVSPIPTLEALDALPLVLMSRGEERAGWPIIDVVDRTREDPAARTHALTPVVMRAVTSGRRVVCVTNTTGQARLLACGACSALARCERCKAAVSMVDDLLVCGRCALVRPPVCVECASSRLKLLRRGTARLRAELASAVGEEVV